MIDFYRRLIDPKSPLRSKLAIHLHAQAATPEEASVPVVSKAMQTLGLSKKSSKSDIEDEYPAPTVEPNGTTPYVIKDVRNFKAMLQISAGPQPVKHISEFEDLDSKL
jgi:insulysin